MSKRFNPVSTAVALATAGLMLTVAGCAMNRSDTVAVGESRDSDRNAERLAQTNPADPTVVANESLRGDQSNPPADSSQMAQSTQYTEPATQPIAQGDTSATPYPPTQMAQAQPATAYPSSTTTDMSSSSTAATMPAPTPAPAYAATTATPATDTSSTTATTATTTSSTEQPLPPRSDRN